VLEDHDRVGIGERGGEHPARVVDGRGREHRQARHVRVPVLEAVRVLRRELPAGAGRHPDHDGHAELPPRHVAVERGRVHDLV